MKKPKVHIKRTPDTITITVKVNGEEVRGSIGKIYPYKGKWQQPIFNWENVGGYEESIKAATRFQAALFACIAATWIEWGKLPEADRVKLKA